jgi:hypothetical protein
MIQEAAVLSAQAAGLSAQIAELFAQVAELFAQAAVLFRKKQGTGKKSKKNHKNLTSPFHPLKPG